MSESTGWRTIRGLRRWLGSVGLALACCACGGADDEGPSTPAVDMDALDTSIDPCSDFYRFACGGWQQSHPLPASASYWRRSDDPFYDMTEDLRPLVQRSSAGVHEADNPDSRTIGAYYNACMNAPEVDRSKVSAQLRRIFATQSVQELLVEGARLRSWGSISFMLLGVTNSLRDATQRVLFVDARGWELPDRDDYLDPERASVRASYLEHIRRMSALFSNNYIDGGVVLEIETALVRAAPTDEEYQDPRRIQQASVDELIALAPHVPWQDMLAVLELDATKPVAVSSFAYLEALEALLANTRLATLQHYVAWQFLQDQAAYSDESVRHTDFMFWGPTFWGTSEPQPRSWYCYTRTVDELAAELSRPYIARYFDDGVRDAARSVVTSIRTALARRLETTSVLDASTRAEALAKLDAVIEQVGYPEVWWSSRGLTLDATSYVETHRTLRAWAIKEQARLLELPVNRDAWGVAPITVNAFFNYSSNKMMLPAGILHSPWFDRDRAEVGNLGTLGWLVGHEFTHGFDASGRLFDAQGNLRDWWSEATATAFEERSQCFVDQYSRFEVLPGETVDGQLTLGENIADAGGMLLAHDVAMARTRGAARQADFDAEQQFFIASAQLHCENRVAESTQTLLLTDSHSPAPARVNATLANLPAFAAAFQCAANAPMVNPTPCSVW